MTNEEKARAIIGEDCKKENCLDCGGRLSAAEGGCDVWQKIMQMAQWKDEEHEQDKLFLEEYKSRCDFYGAFIEYLANECVGSKERIIEAVAEQRNVYVGYVETEKEIKPNGDLVFKFNIDDITYKATWQENDNYAVCQWTGYEPDDYHGYLLLPTFGFKKFFCIYYDC